MFLANLKDVYVSRRKHFTEFKILNLCCLIRKYLFHRYLTTQVKLENENLYYFVNIDSINRFGQTINLFKSSLKHFSIKHRS